MDANDRIHVIRAAINIGRKANEAKRDVHDMNRKICLPWMDFASVMHHRPPKNPKKEFRIKHSSQGPILVESRTIKTEVRKYLQERRDEAEFYISFRTLKSLNKEIHNRNTIKIWLMIIHNLHKSIILLTPKD